MCVCEAKEKIGLKVGLEVTERGLKRLLMIKARVDSTNVKGLFLKILYEIFHHHLDIRAKNYVHQDILRLND